MTNKSTTMKVDVADANTTQSLPPASTTTPRVPLSPQTEEILRKDRDGMHVILDAFGGTAKLCGGRRLYYRINPIVVAQKRVSGGRPAHLSPLECLSFYGLEENETTKSLFRLANWLGHYPGQFRTESVVQKWLHNACGGDNPRSVVGEELSTSNSTGSFESVSLQYLSSDEAFLFSDDVSEEEQKIWANQMATKIEEWIALRPVPDGHTRFFHGTSTENMNNIVKRGILAEYFSRKGDFGPGFYCGATVRTSFRYATLAALEGFGKKKFSASMMYFDVMNEDLDELKRLDLEADDWSKSIYKCLHGEFSDVFCEDRQDVDLVVGSLVYNPDSVEYDDERSTDFVDKRVQYAFRKTAGNLLCKDHHKMGVAVFDVPMPAMPADEEA